MLQEFPRFSRCAVVAAAWGMSVVFARVHKRHGGNGARAAPVPFLDARRDALSSDVFLTLPRIVGGDGFNIF